MRLLATSALIFASVTANASPDYKYCEIAGLAFGADKTFIGSIAARIVDRQGLTGTSACQAVWKDSYNTGKRLSIGGQWSDLDSVKWQKLQDFETRVLDGVIDDLHLGL